MAPTGMMRTSARRRSRWRTRTLYPAHLRARLGDPSGRRRHGGDPAGEIAVAVLGGAVVCECALVSCRTRLPPGFANTRARKRRRVVAGQYPVPSVHSQRETFENPRARRGRSSASRLRLGAAPETNSAKAKRVVTIQRSRSKCWMATTRATRAEPRCSAGKSAAFWVLPTCVAGDHHANS